MPWIRFDCSTLDDEWAIVTLNGDEFKAWALHLLRTKAMGARGRVKTASLSSLSRNWNLPAEAIASMLEKAKTAVNDQGKPAPKLKEANGCWYWVNWSKYQDDYREKEPNISASTETSGDVETPSNGATPPHPTPQDTTPQKSEEDDGAAREKADGHNFEQFILTEWGREGRIGHGVRLQFLDWAKIYGWPKIYEAIHKAALQNVRKPSYVKGILEEKGNGKFNGSSQPAGSRFTPRTRGKIITNDDLERQLERLTGPANGSDTGNGDNPHSG